MTDGAISIRTVAPLPIAAVRRRVTAATVVAEYIKAPIWAQADKRGVTLLGDAVFIYYDGAGPRSLNLPEGVEADLGIRVAEPFEGDILLNCVMTPAGRAACIRHSGHYELLPAIHGDVRAWCADQGFDIAGLHWEHYVHWHEEPSRRVTDIYYLLS